MTSAGGSRRTLYLLGIVGAVIAVAGLWAAPDSYTVFSRVCLGLSLALLAWAQFGEQFRKR